MRARPLIAVAICLALAAAACGSSQPSGVRPGSPSASPVQPEPDPRLVEFDGRVADAVKRGGQLVRALSAASVGSGGQLGLVAREMGDWANGELAWLDEHAAEACYRDAADAYESGLTDIADAAIRVRRAGRRLRPAER